MPLTSDVGAQQTQVDKLFMVLTLIGLRPDLETLQDQILSSPSVPSLDDVFARLLRISSTQTLPSDSPLNSSVLVSHTNLLLGKLHNSLSSRFMRGVRINRSSDTQYLRGSA